MPQPDPIHLHLQTRRQTVAFPRRPLIMGIVNINDDSFSGDGTLDAAAALAQAQRFAAQGADIIDVGAESARTNRGAISVAEEVRRLDPFLRGYGAAMAAAERWDAGQLWPPLLSVNTWRPEVAEAALAIGADLLNDMGGLPDPRNAEICARHGTALLIMHTVGEPKVAHTHQSYADVLGAMEAFFAEKIAAATAAGLPEEAILIDPGLDFAKQRGDNLAVLRHLGRFHAFRRPILLPISRKTVIGDVLGIADPAERDAGTIGLLAAGIAQGAQIFRVHHVEAAAQSAKVLWALERGGAGEA